MDSKTHSGILFCRGHSFVCLQIFEQFGDGSVAPYQQLNRKNIANSTSCLQVVLQKMCFSLLLLGHKQSSFSPEASSVSPIDFPCCLLFKSDNIPMHIGHIRNFSQPTKQLGTGYMQYFWTWECPWCSSNPPSCVPSPHHPSESLRLPERLPGLTWAKSSDLTNPSLTLLWPNLHVISPT